MNLMGPIKHKLAIELMAKEGMSTHDIGRIVGKDPRSVAQTIASTNVQRTVMTERHRLVSQRQIKLLKATNEVIDGLMEIFRSDPEPTMKLSIGEFLFTQLFKMMEVKTERPEIGSEAGPVDPSRLTQDYRELVIRQTAYSDGKSSPDGSDRLRMGTGEPEVVPEAPRADEGLPVHPDPSEDAGCGKPDSPELPP
jgi:hypothetical protein